MMPIVMVEAADRPWLRLAADAIRIAARRDGLRPPAIADALGALGDDTKRLRATNPAPEPTWADTEGVTLCLTTDEAAAALRVNPRTVQRLVKSGALPAIDVGGARRIVRQDLVEYVQRQRQAPS